MSGFLQLNFSDRRSAFCRAIHHIFSKQRAEHVQLPVVGDLRFWDDHRAILPRYKIERIRRLPRIENLLPGKVRVPALALGVDAGFVDDIMHGKIRHPTFFIKIIHAENYGYYVVRND